MGELVFLLILQTGKLREYKRFPALKFKTFAKNLVIQV